MCAPSAPSFHQPPQPPQPPQPRATPRAGLSHLIMLTPHLKIAAGVFPIVGCLRICVMSDHASPFPMSLLRPYHAGGGASARRRVIAPCSHATVWAPGTSGARRGRSGAHFSKPARSADLKTKDGWGSGVSGAQRHRLRRAYHHLAVDLFPVVVPHDGRAVHGPLLAVEYAATGPQKRVVEPAARHDARSTLDNKGKAGKACNRCYAHLT